MCQGDGNQTSGQTASALSAGLGDQVMRPASTPLCFPPIFHIALHGHGTGPGNFNILSGAETLLRVSVWVINMVRFSVLCSVLFKLKNQEGASLMEFTHSRSHEMILKAQDKTRNIEIIQLKEFFAIV